MDKRVTKILICCFACTLIVIVLFLIAIHFSQSSCELIQVDQQQLRISQSNAFIKAKPIRSDDKTILMKFAAYIEYNKSNDDDDDNNDEEKKSTTTTDKQQQQHMSGSLVIAPNSANATSNNLSRTIIQPSNPIGFLNGNSNISAMILDQNKHQAKKRFLPLDLDSIETRHISDSPNKYKYILSFNCTKMNLVLVRHPDRVYVESIKLELKVSNKHKTDCYVQLPTNDAFSASLSQPSFGISSGFNQTVSNNNNNNELSGKNKEFVHYYCKPKLPLPCYHRSSNGGNGNQANATKSNGLHIADLHIIALEFETPVSSSNSETKLKQVSKNEFKSQRRNCDPASS